MTEKTENLHDNLEIHALVEGGYVVREGRYDRSENAHSRDWIAQWERAAFTTLDEALAWMKVQMVNRASKPKK